MRFFVSGYATDYKHTNTAFRNSGRWESSIRVRQILYVYKKETYTLNRRQLYVSLQKSGSRRYGDQPNLERSTVAGRPLEKRKANDQSAAGFWLATKIRKGSVHRIHFFHIDDQRRVSSRRITLFYMKRIITFTLIALLLVSCDFIADRYKIVPDPGYGQTNANVRFSI